jgi:uncharacterized protein (PEP-CTERM system associated)
MAADRPRAAPHAVRYLMAAGALMGVAGPARAQSDASPDSAGETVSVSGPMGGAATVLPQIGSPLPSSVSLQPGFVPGDLNDTLRSLAFGTPVPRATGWTFSPAIGVTQEYDGGGADGGGSQSVFVTSIEPSIAVNGTTTRLQTDFYYAPVARVYEGGNGAGGDDQDRVSQNLNAHVVATLVPSTLFVDLRGAANEQSRLGGLGPSDTTTLNGDDATQNYSFSASPYALHKFGDVGTAELGYSFARTLQDSTTLDSADTGNAALAQALDETGTGNVSTQNAHLAFTTGDAFGRYNAAALASGTSYSGSGVLQDAYRHVASVDNGYAITRTITALGRIGYEDIHYGGSAPVSIHDVLWDIGGRLTLSPSSSVTVRYGHHDGLNALTFSGNVAPTAHTRLYADYSTGLSTQLEDLQNALASADVDSLGAPVDHATGTPIFLSDSFAGVQAGLYRLRRFSAGGEYVRDRDVVTIAVNRDQRRLISGPSEAVVDLGVVASTTDTTGSITWSHELTPKLGFIAYFEYGVSSGGIFTTAAGQDDTTLVGSLSFNYRLGETVSLNALYSYTRNSAASYLVNNDEAGQNRFLVGISKTF